jgi:hypothetical protein
MDSGCIKCDSSTRFRFKKRFSIAFTKFLHQPNSLVTTDPLAPDSLGPMVKRPITTRFFAARLTHGLIVSDIRWVRIILLSMLFWGLKANAQNAPLISGGVGFLTSTNGGVTSLQPVITPVAAVPLGEHLLVESRAFLEENISPKNGNTGPYQGEFFAGLQYLQLDYIAAPKLTVVVGEFLTPFGTYNERLTPIWITNLQDAPLIYPIGNQRGASVGAMLRGAAFSNSHVQLNYVGYFSVLSNVAQFSGERAAGGQFSMYLPDKRLEIGMSYSRLLQDQQGNSTGVHVWWQPYRVPLAVRSEYAHGPHAQGYWVESAYRLSQWNGPDSWLGRLEPVFRLQQTFRDSPGNGDQLPAANTQRVDFGLDYHLPHEVRINTSYARQFSSTGDKNIWETSLTYRFLFPAIWKGGSK